MRLRIREYKCVKADQWVIGSNHTTQYLMTHLSNYQSDL
jgi:hypothetical protein